MTCPFCSPQIDDQVIDGNATCIVIRSDEGALVGSVMVLPRAHRSTPFNLTDAEWRDTRELLLQFEELMTSRDAPDGFTVGWNVREVGGQQIPHAHCHLIPRYADEPYAGRGIRWWIKRDENVRPKAR